MITIFKKKVTLTLEEMMNLQRLSNSLRLENEELRLLLQDAYTLIEVLKRERDSVKRIPSEDHPQKILHGHSVLCTHRGESNAPIQA